MIKIILWSSALLLINPFIHTMNLNNNPKQEKNHCEQPTEALKALARQAALEGSITKISHLLNHGFPINEVLDSKNNTFLHYATIFNHLPLSIFLIRMNASINKSNSDGHRPIDLAIQFYNYELIAFLLNKGIDPSPDFFTKRLPNQVDSIALTVLYIIVNRKYKNAATIYREYYKNDINYSFLALLLKRRGNKKQIIEELNTSDYSAEELTALLPKVLWYDDIELIQLFIDKGAIINTEDNEFLDEEIISTDCNKAIEYVVLRGAKVNAKVVAEAIESYSLKSLPILIEYYHDFYEIEKALDDLSGSALLSKFAHIASLKLLQLLTKYNYQFTCKPSSFYRGQQINEQTYSLYSQMINAILYNDKVKVQTLLFNNATIINLLYHGITPFVLACCIGNKEIISYFLKQEINRNNLTAGLLYAMKFNKKDIITLLLQNLEEDKIDLHESLNQSIMSDTSIFDYLYAFIKQNIANLTKLLAIDLKREGDLIFLALTKRKWNIVLKLLEINISVPKEFSDVYPITIPTIIANKLIERGCNLSKLRVNNKKTDNNVILSTMAQEREVKEYLSLQDKSLVDLSLVSSNQQTPIMWASMFGHEEVIKKAIETNLSLLDQKDKDLKTPLIYAISRENDAITRLLLERKINGKTEYNPYNLNINHQDREGNSALVYAIQTGKVSMIALLLNAGAEVTAKVLYYALKHQDSVTITQLLLSGCKVYGNFLPANCLPLTCTWKEKGICHDDCVCQTILPNLL